jgi:hypothetical protein
MTVETGGGWLRNARLRLMGGFALLGALSGSLASTIAVVSDNPEIKLAGWFVVSPLTVGPGLLFGLAVWVMLQRRGDLCPATGALYMLASTLSYFVTVMLSLRVFVDWFDDIVVVGVVAGLFGSAALSGCAALLLPFARRPGPLLAMVAAGGVLGALLAVPLSDFGDNESFWAWLIFFAGWQAGYAAAFATALPLPANKSPRS